MAGIKTGKLSSQEDTLINKHICNTLYGTPYLLLQPA